jgi:hypothetical protein
MQDKPFQYRHTVDSGLLLLISRETSYHSFSKVERESVYWVGILRRNPSGFWGSFVGPFLDQFPELQGPASRSLEKELMATGPLFILLPASNLQKAAETQADYLSSGGQFSHTGPKGKTFKQRMEDVGIKDCAGENLFEGKADPLVSLILLLIDQGVVGYGHRKALLNPAFTRIGLGVTKEGNSAMIMVQVFSCE